MAVVSLILALLLSGCVSPGIWCEGEVQGETLEAKLAVALDTCAPMLNLTLPSYVAPVEGDE